VDAGRPLAADVSTASPSRRASRITAASLLSLFAALATLYGWQAWRHGAPIIFTDELELTQISRSIADTGHAARRGQPHFFESLITYIWAPAWWIDNVKTAYTVVKLINVVLMTSALFPAYALARLVASRPAALFAAAGTAAIPALSYSPLLLREPLAYPWATLSLFLIAKALITRSRAWIAAAVAVALVGPLVRGELVVLPAAFALALVFFVATGPWARRARASWSRWDWAGATMLALGAVIFVNATLSYLSQSWEIPTHTEKEKIFDLGVQAGAHLAIGLGILPVVAGLAVLLSFRALQPVERRAFASVAWAGLIGFAAYTSVKAAYVSTQFSTLVEERNLIYAAPVLFAATAAWLSAPRVRVIPALAAVGVVGFMLVWKPYQLGYGYFEAPGNGILALANRRFIWNGDTIRTVLLGILAFCGVVVLLPALRRRVSDTWAAAAGGMLAVLPAVVVAWCLTGEIYTASAFRGSAADFLAHLPRPLNWVDRASGGKPVVYFGENVRGFGPNLYGDTNGVHFLEFWNRSITKVWALDGSAPGPGPTQSQDLASTDGRLRPPPGTPYALADEGIVLTGKPIAQRGNLRLYRIDGTLRLLEATRDVDRIDRWMADSSGWSRFKTPGGQPGTVVVTLSRTGFCPTSAPVEQITVRLGKLVIGSDKHPALGAVRARRRITLPRCAAKTVRLPSGKPPFQVELRAMPSLRLSDYGYSDSRIVSAVVSFSFVPNAS
jgi:hypothetical protein